jgi:hypothetical protein|tara:strand:+ start:1951 stop:2292 length:342 start_codon:yes stop_codon:yes gene_type:complete
MPCPVNLRQNITTGSKATTGLNAIKRHEVESAHKTIGPSFLTRIISVRPPAQIITMADAKVPNPYIKPQSPWDKLNVFLISPENIEIKYVCPKLDINVNNVPAASHRLFFNIN